MKSGDAISPFLSELQIIFEEQFECSKEILHQRSRVIKNLPRVPLNMMVNSLLSGNVFCGHCCSRLVMTKLFLGQSFMIKPHRSKKDDCKQYIKRIDVFRDYQLKIEFNFYVRQFFFGIDEEKVLSPNA